MWKPWAAAQQEVVFRNLPEIIKEKIRNLKQDSRTHSECKLEVLVLQLTRSGIVPWTGTFSAKIFSAQNKGRKDARVMFHSWNK
jgi:hypothetical protein